jgi:UDP-3-O-acyl-N-acetylglucosamine deacetylase
LKITERLHVGDAQQWIIAEPTTNDTLEVEYRLDYGTSSPIGKMTYRAQLTEDNFYHEIAPARTFIGADEARAMQSQGIATHVTDQDLLVFDQSGPVNNKLRFPNECARHKALDLIGDLALCGVDLVGRITAYRSGHQLNGLMAEQLRKRFLGAGRASRAA